MSAAHRIRELEQRSEALERRVALLERVDSPAPPADRRAALRVADRPGAHLTGAPPASVDWTAAPMPAPGPADRPPTPAPGPADRPATPVPGPADRPAPPAAARATPDRTATPA